MPIKNGGNFKAVVKQIKLTARVTLPAYDALTEIQRQHRRKTGRALPKWKIISAAILAYAESLGIKRGA